MMRRTQLIAAAIATACAGVGTSAMACGTCGGYGGGYSGYYYSRPAPVGEFITTRSFVRTAPICPTRVIRYVRPAPVGELITTRRVFVRRLAPVGEMYLPRRTCYTRLAPVGERIITRRVIVRRVAPVGEWITPRRACYMGYSGLAPVGEYGGSFGDRFVTTVSTPVRWATWPIRRTFVRTQPEIVGERILVTKVTSCPTRSHVSKRHFKKMHTTKLVSHRKYAHFKKIAPVGEHVVMKKSLKIKRHH